MKPIPMQEDSSITLFLQRWRTRLSEKYEVKKTVVADGYQIPEEHEKFKWADAVIYQTPVYWFSVPALFKKYIDEIYEYGLFYQGSEDYGRGGLFTDKSICFQPHGTRRRMYSPRRGHSSKVKALMKRCFICTKCRNSSA